MTSVAAGTAPALSLRARSRPLTFSTVWILNGAAYGCVWPFVALYAARQGLSLAAIGVLSALGAASAATLQPLLGRLLDRTQRPRTILAATTLGGALGDLGLAHAHAAPLLLLCAAVGMAAFYGTRVVLVPLTLTALEHSGQGAARFARYRICSPLGFTLTGIVGGLLLGHVSFGLLFSGGALLYLAMGLSGLALPAAPSPPERRAATGTVPAAAHPHRVLLTLALMAWLYGLASSCSDTYVPLLMRHLHGSFLQVGLAGTLVTAVEVPLMLLFGRLADRGQRAVVVLVLGMTLLPLRFALSFLVQAPLQLLGVQLLDGPTFAAFAIVGVALLTAQTPPERRAWALSVYAAAGTAGPVVGPLLAGLAAGQVGIQPMFGLVALGMAGVPLLVAVGLWPLLRWRPAAGGAAS